MKLHAVFLFSLLVLSVFGTSLRHQKVIKEKQKLVHIPLQKQVLTSDEKGARIEFVKTKQKYMFGDIDLDYDDFEKQYSSDSFIKTSESSTTTSTNYGQQALDAGKAAQEKQKKLHDIKLYNFKNTQYTGQFALGSETNTFDVIYDTGSANLWIDSVRCSDKGCKNHKQYDGSSSSTYEELGLDLEVEFGTGGLSGSVNSDTAYFGGIPIEKQAFAEIVQEDGAVFAESKFDGIVGLAFPSMAAYDQNPVFDNIIQQQKLDSNVFSFYLQQHDGQSDSKITLGGVDESTYTGKINYHKVIDEYYWLLKADNILIGGEDHNLCGRNGCNVIADTGTSLLTGPSDDLYEMLTKLNVDDGCQSVSSLPDITFVLDGVDYTLTPEEYVMSVTGNGVMEDYGDMTTADKSDSQCAAAFMPLDIPEPQGPAWILGDVFLAKYLSVYDRDQGRVGFALAKHHQ